MAPNGSRGTAGRVEQHAIRFDLRVVVAGVCKNQIGVEAEPGKIFPQSLQSSLVTLHGTDARTLCTELRGLPSGRCTKIDDLAACNLAEQLCRQGGGKILNPE